MCTLLGGHITLCNGKNRPLPCLIWQAVVQCVVCGKDCYDAIVQGMTLKLRNGLKGTPTIFGWILHGGNGSVPVTGVVARAHAQTFRASVHEQLQDFWTLDHLGVTSDEMLDQDLELKVKNAILRDESGKYVVS